MYSNKAPGAWIALAEANIDKWFPITKKQQGAGRLRVSTPHSINGTAALFRAHIHV